MKFSLFFSLLLDDQVHKRISYLRHLIVSLAQAKDISKVLLVFSHDFYDEDINDLVQTIDFCKVLQVIYIVSILQLHVIKTYPIICHCFTFSLFKCRYFIRIQYKRTNMNFPVKIPTIVREISNVISEYLCDIQLLCEC